MTEINVKDLVSGSALHITSSNLGDITGRSYSAKAYGFGTNSTGIKQEHLPQVVISPSIETSNSSSDVTIKTTETSKFTPGTRPITKFFNYEKSMYQVISDRMLEFMAGLDGFNDMIGAPVNKYRQDYKSLDKMRQSFFDRVENDVDLDKFVEYYRWIDGSVSNFLNQLAPATANMSSKLRNTVDSHLLERNKYKHQAPTIEFKFNDDTHSIFGINELLYNWRLGHTPLENIDSSNCLWAQERRQLDDVIKEHPNTVQSLKITNASNFVSFGDDALWTPYTDFTFGGNYFASPRGVIWSFYVKVDDTSIDNILVEKENEFTIKALTGGHLFVRFGKSVNNLTIQKNSAFTQDQWHHVLIHEQKHSGTSFSENSLLAYIDGTLVTSFDTREENGTYVGLIQGDAGHSAYDDTDEDLVIMKGKVSMVDLVYAINGASAESSKFTSKAKNIDFFRSVDANTQIPLRVDYVGQLISGSLLPLLSNGAAEAADQMLAYWPLSDGYYADGANGVQERVSSNHGAASNASTSNLELNSPYRPQSSKVPVASINTARRVITTEVSGSTYTRRALVKPYRLASDYSPATIEKRDSAKESYKLVDTDSTKLTLSSDDLIRERDYCKTISTDTFDDGKYEYDTKILVGGESQNSKALLPISFNSSSVIDQIQELKPGLEVTNLPENQDRFILQGPFTRQHVGSMPHRRQAITLDEMNRHEAYNIEVNPSSLTMSAVPIGDPSSRFTRGIGVSSPYNVENIRFSTASNFLGNYQQPYEIVQTNGRNSANVQFVKDGGITDIVNNSLFLSGTPDFANINRGRNRHVVSNRFAAPGGPETSPALTADRETGELSIYNTLNYRNLFPVRTVQNSLLSQKSEQFGVVSSSLGPKSGGSTHKTQRNTRFKTEILTSDGTPILTASFDNAYVAKPIPQSAFQYSWISGNLSSSAANFINTNDGYGYVHSFYNSSGPGEGALKLNLGIPSGLESNELFNDSCLRFVTSSPDDNDWGQFLSTTTTNFNFDGGSTSVDAPFALSFNFRIPEQITSSTSVSAQFEDLTSVVSIIDYDHSAGSIMKLLIGETQAVLSLDNRPDDPANSKPVRYFLNLGDKFAATPRDWHHMVFKYHGTGAVADRVSMFIDGELVNETPEVSDSSYTNNNIQSKNTTKIAFGGTGAVNPQKKMDLYDFMWISGAVTTAQAREVYEYSRGLGLKPYESNRAEISQTRLTSQTPIPFQISTVLKLI